MKQGIFQISYYVATKYYIDTYNILAQKIILTFHAPIKVQVHLKSRPERSRWQKVLADISGE